MGLYSDFKNSRVTAHGIPAKIMVIGVGGAGGNTVDHIYTLSIKGVNLMICNTDSKALDKSPLGDTQKICMGDGKGAGNDASVGQNKAKESLPTIREYVKQHNPDLIFLTAGMGGGTGTGATPVIAQMIHSLNIPLIAILTTPSINEGKHRFDQAMNGISIMQDFVDTFIIIRNETIITLCDDRSVHDAFNMANDVVAYAAKGIAEIALTQSDLVSVDISDVCKVVRNSHYAVMGMAAESGADRVITAIDKAVLSPLFGGVPIEGAKEVLVNFATASSGDLKMKEVNKALDHIQNIAAGKDENGDNIPVNIIWGTSIKPELEDKIEIIIVVTGFHADSYYHEAFGGKLGLTMESKTAAAPEPEQPTPPITIAVEQPKPAPQPVQPKPAPVPQVVEPVQPKPVQPKPAPQVVEPVQPKPAPAPQVVEPKPAPKPAPAPTPKPAPQPVQPKPAPQPQVVTAEPWRVAIPERVAPKPITPQALNGNYQLDANTPAYKSRRGMMLMNEIKGRKVVIKMDGSVVSNEEVAVDNSTQQQALDF
jgi:cell division protein FtsZ